MREKHVEHHVHATRCPVINYLIINISACLPPPWLLHSCLNKSKVSRICSVRNRPDSEPYFTGVVTTTWTKKRVTVTEEDIVTTTSTPPSSPQKPRRTVNYTQNAISGPSSPVGSPPTPVNKVARAPQSPTPPARPATNSNAGTPPKPMNVPAIPPPRVFRRPTTIPEGFYAVWIAQEVGIYFRW